MLGKSEVEELDLSKMNKGSSIRYIGYSKKWTGEGATTTYSIIISMYGSTVADLVVGESGSYMKTYNVRDKLLKYSSFKVLFEIERFVDLDDLYELLLYIEGVYGFKPVLSFSVIPETNEFDSVDIVLEDCTWDEWVRLARESKEWLRKQGKDELARQVSIVCLRGLQEPKL